MNISRYVDELAKTSVPRLHLCLNMGEINDGYLHSEGIFITMRKSNFHCQLNMQLEREKQKSCDA